MDEVVQVLSSLSRRMRAVLLACLLLPGLALGAEPMVTVAVAHSGKAFLVDATVDAPVAVGTAWGVLTDFDHMTAILGNLTASRVVSRDGNTLVVRQQGVARYGFLSMSFESEREMRLEPMKRILARSLSGSVKRMESEAKLFAGGQGTQIRYHAEVEPDSMLARMFGAPFIRHEVEEQFVLMAKEMIRRQLQPAAESAPAPLAQAR